MILKVPKMRGLCIMCVIYQGKEGRGGFDVAAFHFVASLVFLQDVVVFFVIRLDAVGRFQARSQNHLLPREEQG